MTPADIITEARVLIQDSRTPYRYSDTVLLNFVNQTLKRMSILRPDLFLVLGDIPTTAGTVIQSCPTDSLRLVEIFQIKNGDAVTEVNREVLDQMYPNWVNEAAGTPVNFMRHVRNPNKFFLYPRPVAGITLVGEYAQVPPRYTIDQTITALPDSYLPVAVDGVVFLSQSVDDEHVTSGRAKLFQDSFNQTLAAGLQVRTLTDTEEGGMDPKQVI
jgi:hypothetical protein